MKALFLVPLFALPWSSLPAAAPSVDELETLAKQRSYAEAHAGAMEALAELEFTGNDPSRDAARILQVLLYCTYEGGRTLSEEDDFLLDGVARKAEAACGPESLCYARIIIKRANLLSYEGRFIEGTELAGRSLAIQEKVLGPVHPDLGDTLSEMMFDMRRLGRDADVLLYARRLVALWEARPGPPSAELAGALLSLGQAYRTIRDYPRALEAAKRSLRIRERLFGPEHHWVGTSLDGLADIYRSLGDFQHAKALSERAVRIWERELGPEDSTFATGLVGLALAQSGLGEHEAAEATARRAMQIGEKSTGPDGWRTPFYLNGLAEVLSHSPNPARARETWEQILRIQERSFGPNHRALVSTLSGMARVEYAAGDYEAAATHALRAESIGRNNFLDLSRVLSEREALAYQEVQALGTQIALSILDLGKERSAAGIEAVWNQMIGSRSVVLDEMAFRHRFLAGAGPEVEALKADLARASERLSAATVRGPGSSTPTEHRAVITRLVAGKEQVERTLAERSAEFRDRMATSRAGLHEVRAALPSGSALVAFFRFSLLPLPAAGEPKAPAPVPSYLALVLPAGRRDPIAIPLGPADRIDTSIRRWKEALGPPRSYLSDRSEERYREISRSLRKLIWDPLSGGLRGARQVFIVPDGAIHLVSFYSLPVENGGYLVEGGPLIHYLSTERDLLRQAPPSGAHRKFLALGGPDFDAPADELRLETAQLETGSGVPGAPKGRTVFRSAPPECQDFGSMRFGILPDAAREISEIGSLWPASGAQPSAAKPSLSLSGRQATETAFKVMAPDFQVVHVATHGFFLQDRCQPPKVPNDSAKARSSQEDSPMLLSGLAFAGANRRRTTDPADDDGILTAEEIAVLDLSHVEWAVLSGCETGLGKVQDGEGVMGLRRAFELAGAQTLIMSLWKVEDSSTREWMHRLYEQRLEGRSTPEAIRAASLGLLQARRAQGRSTHPFYWAAFVAAGNWR
ncbi:MAG TPA: CHAT domain-containing tetratricopeptide repeat protein [Candidatus Polarisedimenticolia bacterium]|nr:CHAT domain-containing tetratricopeptide repeat protein [Candidatus Polarisedimenticolia bacterium]